MIPPDIGLDLLLLNDFGTSLSEVILDTAHARISPAVANVLQVSFDQFLPGISKIVEGAELSGTVITAGGACPAAPERPALKYESETFRFRATVSGVAGEISWIEIIEFVPANWPDSPDEWPDEC